uniref:Uncharacterized protein n=1 Tax=Nelumbo nucifera TaxID=4432 RepID=A0A822ZNW5_NELNU|nr:TPA_asm: hypothetical protein HUJ06_016431 [Nelumbo nucifera]
MMECFLRPAKSNARSSDQFVLGRDWAGDVVWRTEDSFLFCVWSSMVSLHLP